ncbi:MAG: hypothetical protein JJT75_09260 [Opitutales bacterium]|nr:hypothetical protein [Opitutales bacterium]MCH8541508.1 hypothetical protein [Opitutales bacterium]
MQKTILDLPHLNQRIDLLTNQWKDLEKWMQNEDITFRQLSPEEASLPTDDQTSMVYQVTSNNEKVRDFLQSTK